MAHGKRLPAGGSHAKKKGAAREMSSEAKSGGRKQRDMRSGGAGMKKQSGSIKRKT